MFSNSKMGTFDLQTPLTFTIFIPLKEEEVKLHIYSVDITSELNCS